MNNIIYVNSQAEATAKGYKYFMCDDEGKGYWFPDRKNWGLFLREIKNNPCYSNESLFCRRVGGHGAYGKKIYAIIMKEHPELLENLVEDVYYMDFCY